MLCSTLYPFYFRNNLTGGTRERYREIERETDRERERERERQLLYLYCFFLSCDCYYYLPFTQGALGWSEVCDCGISLVKLTDL